MFLKLKQSLKNINHKLYISLLVMGFVPTIYTTLRVFLLGTLPQESSYSIAGQLAWINLIYEVIYEAIILLLFYFVGKSISDKKELTNRIKTGLLLTSCVYIILSIIVITCVGPLLKAMVADPSIINASTTYIRIEAVANMFDILFKFAFVGLIVLGKDKLVYILTGTKLILCVVSDIFLISSLTVSANLGVNGIGVTNNIVNGLLFFVTLIILAKNGINVFSKDKISFTWVKHFLKIGGISGLESFIRNLIYMIMIVRMVNIVDEQGTYWVANNFIWGWMLLPILQLGELIKQETSTNKDAVKNNTLGYFLITLIILVIWSALIPTYKPFIQYVLNFNDVDKLFKIIMTSFGFYALFAIQNVFENTFYGLGKTWYILFESIVTNIIYYGILLILYMTEIWQPSLMNIVLLFGIGNALDAVVSFGAYWYLLKKIYINILNIEPI